MTRFWQFNYNYIPCRCSLLLLLVYVISCVFIRIVGVFVGWWKVYPPLIPAGKHTSASLLTPQLKAQKFHTISSGLYLPFTLSNY